MSAIPGHSLDAVVLGASESEELVGAGSQQADGDVDPVETQIVNDTDARHQIDAVDANGVGVAATPGGQDHAGLCRQAQVVVDVDFCRLTTADPGRPSRWYVVRLVEPHRTRGPVQDQSADDLGHGIDPVAVQHAGDEIDRIPLIRHPRGRPEDLEGRFQITTHMMAQPSPAGDMMPLMPDAVALVVEVFITSHDVDARDRIVGAYGGVRREGDSQSVIEGRTTGR